MEEDGDDVRLRRKTTMGCFPTGWSPQETYKGETRREIGRKQKQEAVCELVWERERGAVFTQKKVKKNLKGKQTVIEKKMAERVKVNGMCLCCSSIVCLNVFV